VFEIYPASSLVPISEWAAIPDPLSGGGPFVRDDREWINSVPRSLVGGTFPLSVGAGKYLLRDGANGYFMIRGGSVFTVARGVPRKVYDGPITSMAALADGTYMATDGARLLRFYPYSVDGKLQISRMPGSSTHQLTMLASDASRYDIQASGDLRGWTNVATGLQGGVTYTLPPEGGGQYFRAQPSGN